MLPVGPYLCAASHARQLGLASERADNDTLLGPIEPAALPRLTGLYLIPAFLETLRRCAPQLTSLRIVTRGLLRAPGLAAGSLLEQWLTALRSTYSPLGLDVRMNIDPSCHTRRLVLQGLWEAAEVRPEWGLAWWLDTRAKRDAATAGSGHSPDGTVGPCARGHIPRLVAPVGRSD